MTRRLALVPLVALALASVVALQAWAAEAGEFRVRVGGSSRPIRSEAPLTLKTNLAVAR